MRSHPLLLGPATTTAKPHAVQRQRRQHPRGAKTVTATPTQHKDGNGDTHAAQQPRPRSLHGTTTRTAKPHMAQRPRPRHHTQCKDSDGDTTCGAKTTTTTPMWHNDRDRTTI